jgi:hypothetical protein
MAANSYHVIEGDVPQFGNVFGSLAGNINARLGHDTDRIRVQAMRLDPGRVRLDRVALESPRPAFSHLAAAGIARAEKEDFRLLVHLGLFHQTGFKAKTRTLAA